MRIIKDGSDLPACFGNFVDCYNLKYLDEKELLFDLDGNFDIIDKNSAILSGSKTYSISLKSTIEQNLFEELKQQIVILRDIYK